MKKISKSLKVFFRSIGLFFDKWLITPITKLILWVTDVLRNALKNLDRLSGKKSTLLVVSLILAFSVFVLVDRQSSVMIDQYAEILYDQPVKAIDNEELYVVEGLPKTVDITLIGQRRHIFLAKQVPSKGVSVDLTGLKPGNHRVTLKYTQRLKSLDYKLDPSVVTVTIYPKVSENKTITYDILHSDNLDSKLYINNVELDRSEVIIKGAQYKLDKVASVKALVDVDDIPNPKAGEITVKNIPLVAYDNDGKILSDVEIVPKTVTANVTITSPSKEVPIKVVPKGNLAFGKSIKSMDTSISKITVYGSQAAVDKMEQFEVEIDVSGLDKNKDYNVTLTKPKGITDLSSKTITIKVVVDNSSTKEFKDIPITTRNIKDGYVANAASSDDQKVDVVVTGSSDALANLKSSDITAYVDLEKFSTEGEHEVPVKVTGTDLKLSYTSKSKKVKIVVSKK